MDDPTHAFETIASGCRKVSSARLFALGLLAFAATLTAMTVLPHDRYVRWQAVRTEAFARLGWDYERIHFDKTPIDIAFVGTSHTMNGIDGLAVAKRIAAGSVRGADGQCLTTANLAIPAYGRDLHWLVARELLSQRRPKAIVLEVFENETRKPHPLFYEVATSRDILTAPILGNMSYVKNLIRLPQRQLELGIKSLAPEEFGLGTHFDPTRYDGSNVDNTRVVNVHGQAFTPPLTRVLDPRKLEAEAAANRANKRLNMLPERFADYEYAMPNRYVREILELAKEKQVPVYLLYLPGYGQPPAPYDMQLYGDHKLLTVNDLLAHREFWHDVHHLNSHGAAEVSQRVGELLAREMVRSGVGKAGGGGGCDFGYPQRPIAVPFRGMPAGDAD